jgi:hypothetical protein
VPSREARTRPRLHVRVRPARVSTARTSAAIRFETRKATLASLLRGSLPGLRLNEHLTQPGDLVFRHACKMGLEGIVSKRLGSPYRSGRCKDWLKFKNPEAPAVRREAEEEWGKRRFKGLSVAKCLQRTFDQAARNKQLLRFRR